MLAYVICGVLVGIGSYCSLLATYTTVQPGYGDQYNNEAIAGCVMGGTSMAGGFGIYWRYCNWCTYHLSVYSRVFLASWYWSKDYQFIITGIIVIAAVYADVSARRRKN